MIRQYAIEPVCLGTWERWRFFIDQCGPHQGRLIIEFPREWREQLLALLRKKEGVGESWIQHKSIFERLRRAERERKFIARLDASCYTYDRSRSWVDNALAEHRRCRFDGVVAENAADHESILVADAVDGSDPRWQVRRSRSVQRTPKVIAEVVAPLLAVSSELVFVDRYFLFWDRYANRVKPSKWHLSVLRELFRKFSKKRFARVEYHCGNHDDRKTLINWATVDWDQLDRDIRRDLPPDLPINLVIWPHDDLHNRFVLTDVAGLEFGEGLDEKRPSSRRDDDVGLMDHDHWAQRWSEYNAARKPPQVQVHQVKSQRELLWQQKYGDQSRQFRHW